MQAGEAQEKAPIVSDEQKQATTAALFGDSDNSEPVASQQIQEGETSFQLDTADKLDGSSAMDVLRAAERSKQLEQHAANAGLLATERLSNTLSGGGDITTRAVWVQKLVKTFNLTVLEEDYPEAFFSDLDSTSSYYNDIMAAIEFGAIAIDNGQPFDPNGAVTREFAAQTANALLGVAPLSETYSFNSAETQFPDADQVAIDRGWFTVSGTSFAPNDKATSQQLLAILTDAASTLNAEVVDENAQNTIEFADFVKQVPHDSAVAESNGMITIYDPSVSIAQGDTFTVYLNETIPSLYVANSVRTENGALVIETSPGDEDAAIVNVVAEGAMGVDLANYQEVDGVSTQCVQGDLLSEDIPDELMGARGISYDSGSKSLVAKKDISLGSAKGTATLEVSQMRFDYKINLMSGYYQAAVKGKYKLILTVSGKADFNATFAVIPVQGVGAVKITQSISFSGSVAYTQPGTFTAGLVKERGKGFRDMNSFTKGHPSITVCAEVRVGFRAAFEVNALCVIKGTIYAEIGVRTNMKVVQNSGGHPDLCVTINGYLYALIGLDVRVGKGQLIEPFTKEFSIWSERNSPLRIRFHFEDSKRTNSCAVTGSSGYGWFTGSDSSYAYGFLDGVGESTGYDAEGKPYTIFEYECDGDGNATITKYRGNVGSLIIPDTLDGHTVVGIGPRAFEGNGYLSVVVFPGSVTEIEYSAFEGCRSLSQADLPSRLERLGESAFGDDDLLTSVRVPATLTSCYKVSPGRGPYRGCDGVKELTFAEGCTEVPEGLMAGCTGIESVDSIPSTVTKVERYAFYGCENLKSVKIPGSVTEIEYSAFEGCRSLSQADLPSRLERLGESAFGDDDLLTSVRVPATLTSCYKVSPGRGPYRGCDGVKELTFAEGCTEVPEGLMAGCTGIESVDSIPSTVTKVERYAFYGCENLKSVKIPGSVTEIEYSAFEGCRSLVQANIPDKVTKVSIRFFKDCSSLESISLPKATTSIGDEAFSGCASLASIDIPDAVTDMGDGAFEGCSTLSKVKFSGGMTSVSRSTFKGCASLINVDFLPNTIEAIGSEAFANCDALESVSVPASVAALGESAFSDCDSLKTISLCYGLRTIGKSAFWHCDALENVTVPYGVETIDDHAFGECTQLTSVALPRTLTSAHDAAFSYPDEITAYGISDTYAETYAKARGMKFVNREVHATKATLAPAELKMNNGAKGRLWLTVEPANFTDEVIWKSSNSDVASFLATSDYSYKGPGTVKANGVGNVTIKVAVGDAAASGKITVVQPVTNIWLNNSKLTLEALDSAQLNASVYPSDAANTSVAWASSDESVAAVDQTGKVTAKKKGTATITVTAQDGSGVKASCQVTVPNTGYVVSSVDQLESPHNYVNDSSDFWVYSVAGAAQLDVTFDERTSVEEVFDFLYVYDADSNEVGKYSGTELAGKTVQVPGNTVKIKLVADKAGNEWGFKVTSVKASGTQPDPDPKPDPEPDPDPEPEPSAAVKRLAGDSAAETSAAVALEAFPEGSEWVVVARDDDFADAMSATGLAGALNAPIVLTDRFGLSGAAADAVRRLGAAKAYVIGGKGAIPADLEGQLAGAGCQVQGRVYGECSWDTSVECAKKIAEHGGNPGGDVVVAMSTNFQDALSISSFAYRYRVPILLETDEANGRCLTDEAASLVAGLPGAIYVPGGTGAVPESSVEGAFGKGRVVRLAGWDGYDTSNQIATYMVDHGLLSASTVCLASGAPDPKGVDALAGAALAGRNGGVVLLANARPDFGDPESYVTVEGCDSAGAPAFLSANAGSVSRAYVLGGAAVMPPSLVDKIANVLS